MKKTLCMGVLALGAVLVPQQQASAWTNVKFGCGLNFEWTSGGGHSWGFFCQSTPDCMPQDCNSFATPGFDFFGPMSALAPNSPMPATATARQQQTQPAPANQAAGYFQPVSYPQYYYNTNSYAVPNTTGFSYGAAPSYWYSGR